MPRPPGPGMTRPWGGRTMTTANLNPDVLQQGTVEGADGQNIGRVGQVYLDNETGPAELGDGQDRLVRHQRVVRAVGRRQVEGDTIRVPYDKDMIKGAPHNEVGVPLTEIRRAGAVPLLRGRRPDRLRHHHVRTGHRSRHRIRRGTARTGQGGDYLTRSEEQLHVGHREGGDRPGPAAQVRGDRGPDRHRPGQPRGSPAGP